LQPRRAWAIAAIPLIQFYLIICGTWSAQRQV
jgi:hypothetical protein